MSTLKGLKVTIFERLKQIRLQTGKSQTSFASELGLAQTTYGPYETGRRSVPDDLKLQLADKYGINLHWLITGQGSMNMGKGSGESAPTHARANDDLKEDVLKDSVVVAMTSLRVSAGPGQSWSDADVTGEKLCISKRVARRYPRNSDFAGAQVIGDSMEPTLHDGEPVVYVRDYIQGDGIYVLAVNEELLVKRLQFDRIFNRLHIISDNTKYRPVEIPLEGLDNVRILGKVVIWVHGEV